MLEEKLLRVQTHGAVEGSHRGKHMMDCCVLSSKDNAWEKPTSETAQPPAWSWDSPRLGNHIHMMPLSQTLVFPACLLGWLYIFYCLPSSHAESQAAHTESAWVQILMFATAWLLPDLL